MSTPTCWQCGVEPVEMYDITTFSDPEPVYLPQWPPPTGHEHATVPPTPTALLAAADAARDRMLRNWDDR